MRGAPQPGSARARVSTRATAGTASLLLGLALAACATPARGPALADLELRDLDGRAVAAAGLRGRALLLYLLTTGCDACLADLDKLRALDARHAARGLTVVLVAMDPGDGRVVEAFADSLGSPFALLRAGDALARGHTPLGPVAQVPRVVVLDAARRVVLDATGVRPYAELEAAVTAALAGPGGASVR